MSVAIGGTNPAKDAAGDRCVVVRSKTMRKWMLISFSVVLGCTAEAGVAVEVGAEPLGKADFAGDAEQVFCRWYAEASSHHAMLADRGCPRTEWIEVGDDRYDIWAKRIDSHEHYCEVMGWTADSEQAQSILARRRQWLQQWWCRVEERHVDLAPVDVSCAWASGDDNDHCIATFGSGHACIEGRCALRGAVGRTCDVDYWWQPDHEDCRTDLRCFNTRGANGTCQRSCADGLACPGGYACGDDEYCVESSLARDADPAYERCYGIWPRGEDDGVWAPEGPGLGSGSSALDCQGNAYKLVSTGTCADQSTFCGRRGHLDPRIGDNCGWDDVEPCVLRCWTDEDCHGYQCHARSFCYDA